MSGREGEERATLISLTEGISFTRQYAPVSFNASSLPPHLRRAGTAAGTRRGEPDSRMAPTALALGLRVAPLSCSSQTGGGRGINSVAGDREQWGEGGKAGQGQLLCPF